jgi:hypothetical protein
MKYSELSENRKNIMAIFAGLPGYSNYAFNYPENMLKMFCVEICTLLKIIYPIHVAGGPDHMGVGIFLPP